MSVPWLKTNSIDMDSAKSKLGGKLAKTAQWRLPIYNSRDSLSGFTNYHYNIKQGLHSPFNPKRLLLNLSRILNFQLFPERKASDQQICAAVMAAVLGDQGLRTRPLNTSDPFNLESGVRFNHLLTKTVELSLGDVKIDAKVTTCGGNEYIVSVGSKNFSVSGHTNQVSGVNKTPRDLSHLCVNKNRHFKIK